MRQNGRGCDSAEYELLHRNELGSPLARIPSRTAVVRPRDCRGGFPRNADVRQRDRQVPFQLADGAAVVGTRLCVAPLCAVLLPVLITDKGAPHTASPRVWRIESGKVVRDFLPILVTPLNIRSTVKIYRRIQQAAVVCRRHVAVRRHRVPRRKKKNTRAMFSWVLRTI